jgi:hypothetical protein
MTVRPVLDDRDILQTNAAIIAGILILLTLTSITNTATNEDVMRLSLTLLTIAPFTISSAIILHNNFAISRVERQVRIAGRLSMVGFVYMTVTIAAVVIFYII